MTTAPHRAGWRTVRDGKLAGRRLVAVFDVTAGGPEQRSLLPVWGSLAVFFAPTGGDGLPDGPTSARLAELEHRLHTLLLSSGRSRAVGVVTTAGRCELILYTAVADDLRAAARALQEEFTEFELQLTLMEDPDWEVFRQFVPRDG